MGVCRRNVKVESVGGMLRWEYVGGMLRWNV